MAKRTRYPNRTRPAPKRPRPASSTSTGPRPITSPADAPIPVDLEDDAPMFGSSASLTDAEIRRAEELEAESTARERAAIAESLRQGNRQQAESIASRDYHPSDVNAPLSVRAAHEYAYVARDVKRIIVTAALMLGILATLYILTNVLGVISL